MPTDSEIKIRNIENRTAVIEEKLTSLQEQGDKDRTYLQQIVLLLLYGLSMGVLFYILLVKKGVKTLA